MQLIIFSIVANKTKNSLLLILVFWNIAFILLRVVSISYFLPSIYFRRINEPHDDALSKSITCLLLMNCAAFLGIFIGKKLSRFENKKE